MTGITFTGMDKQIGLFACSEFSDCFVGLLENLGSHLVGSLVSGSEVEGVVTEHVHDGFVVTADFEVPAEVVTTGSEDQVKHSCGFFVTGYLVLEGLVVVSGGHGVHGFVSEELGDVAGACEFFSTVSVSGNYIEGHTPGSSGGDVTVLKIIILGKGQDTEVIFHFTEVGSCTEVLEQEQTAAFTECDLTVVSSVAVSLVSTGYVLVVSVCSELIE